MEPVCHQFEKYFSQARVRASSDTIRLVFILRFHFFLSAANYVRYEVLIEMRLRLAKNASSPASAAYEAYEALRLSQLPFLDVPLPPTIHCHPKCQSL